MSQVDPDYQHHSREAKANSEEVRHAGLNTIIHARRHNHNIIGARRNGCRKSKEKYRNKNFHEPILFAFVQVVVTLALGNY